MAYALIVATVVCGIAYIESQTKVISNFVEDVVDGLQQLEQTIGEGIKKWQKFKDDWDDFQNKVGLILTTYIATLATKINTGKTDRHHIVAKADNRALVGRMILIACDIDINSEINLANVRKELHWVLHTNTYHAIINHSMIMAYIFGGKDGVRATLKAFKKVLEGG